MELKIVEQLNFETLEGKFLLDILQRHFGGRYSHATLDEINAFNKHQEQKKKNVEQSCTNAPSTQSPSSTDRMLKQAIQWMTELRHGCSGKKLSQSEVEDQLRKRVIQEEAKEHVQKVQQSDHIANMQAHITGIIQGIEESTHTKVDAIRLVSSSSLVPCEPDKLIGVKIILKAR